MLLIIDLIVNIILENHAQPITTNIQVKSSQTFERNPREIPKKRIIFSKVPCSKNEFIYTYFSRFFLKV